MMTFFSHRPGFSDFTFLYCIKCRIRPFLHQKNHYSEKNSLITQFFYSVLSRASDNTTSLNIGGTNAWAVTPPQILGDRPLGLHPWSHADIVKLCRSFLHHSMMSFIHSRLPRLPIHDSQHHFLFFCCPS